MRNISFLYYTWKGRSSTECPVHISHIDERRQRNVISSELIWLLKTRINTYIQRCLTFLIARQMETWWADSMLLISIRHKKLPLPRAKYFLFNNQSQFPNASDPKLGNYVQVSSRVPIKRKKCKPQEMGEIMSMLLI